MKHQKQPHVIIPGDINPFPLTKEVTAAQILARFFEQDVEFVKSTNYKTPDFLIGLTYWELKSPIGKGKHLIQRNLQRAAKQSSNIVLDVRKTKIHIYTIKREATRQLKLIKQIKRLLIITKAEEIIEIFR